MLRAEAYRKRVQTLADYMNAYPVADWPRFALAIGASLLTAGSAIAATTSLANEADKLAASVLWLGAAVIGAVSLLVLRANQQVREKRYYEARQLFWQWANRVQEPYIVWDSDGVVDGTGKLASSGTGFFPTSI